MPGLDFPKSGEKSIMFMEFFASFAKFDFPNVHDGHALGLISFYQ
jgi:hypothetical protein